jgi:hypothetical protein
VEARNASLILNGQQSFANFTKTTGGIVLNGPSLDSVAAQITSAQPNWLPNATTAWQGQSLGMALANQQLGMGGSSAKVVKASAAASGMGLATDVPQAPAPMGSFGLASLPVPGGLKQLNYGGWLTPPTLVKNSPLKIANQNGDGTAAPWQWIHPFEASAWGGPSKAYTDVAGKTAFLKSYGPGTMWATALWGAQMGTLPAGVMAVDSLLKQLLDEADRWWGVMDAMTNGLTARLRQWTGLTWLVNTSSQQYLAGVITGEVLKIALAFSPLGGWAGTTLVTLEVVGAVLNANDLYSQGDYRGGTTALMMALVPLMSQLSACKYLGRAATAETLGAKVGYLALGWGIAGLQVAVGGYLAVDGVMKIQEGDTVGGLLSLGASAGAFSGLLSACFTGETKVLTRRGWVRMDELKALDEVLSCDENEPLGEVGYKKVLEVFTFELARIWHVQVKGKVIRTTSEHPFYVWGKGWRAARELEIGDRFRSHDGRMVEEVGDSGTWEKVYNCAVEDWRTYFVGEAGWGFDVWAHNACSATSGENKAASKGRKAHKDFNWGDGFEKEVTLPSGKRADALDWETRTVGELKPNNPRAIKRGQNQLNAYVKELEAMTPGLPWNTRLETY